MGGGRNREMPPVHSDTDYGTDEWQNFSISAEQLPNLSDTVQSTIEISNFGYKNGKAWYFQYWAFSNWTLREFWSSGKCW